MYQNNNNSGGYGGQSQKPPMVQGNWKCSGCNGDITQLPFNPDPARLNQLLCRDCHKQRQGSRR